MSPVMQIRLILIILLCAFGKALKIVYLISFNRITGLQKAQNKTHRRL